MIMKTLTAIILLTLALAGFASERFGPYNSPYGVCAHLNRWEFPQMPQELQMMREAGIDFVRTDLDWNQVEPRKGEWDFAKWDALVDAAGRNKIAILPILGGMQPRWGSPLTEHMADWKNYVTAAVNRYKDRIRCWEVVNEPDLGEFAGNHAKYARFLKESYDCIKTADPDAIVTTGGLAEMEKIGEFLKLAPPDSFDVLNIHRYYWQDYPEGEFRALLRKIKSEMKQYGHADKPVWLTETGYSTAPAPDLAGILAYALNMLKLGSPSLPVVLIDDDDYLYSTECVNLDPGSFFKEKRTFHRIPLAGLADLDPKKYPLLLLPMNEGYPAVFGKALASYLEKGGTVIYPGGGIPFYYNRVRHPDGSIEHLAISDQVQKMLHIAWEAWWINKNAPKSTGLLEAAPEIQGLSYPKSANRYLGRKNLQPGDELIPIVSARSQDGSWSAPVAGIYRFNSNLKGNFIVFSWQEYSHRTTPEWQAMLLPRTYLLAFNENVQKIFTYSFRSMEQYFPTGREGHFGIFRLNLTPKPAYAAYATLTRMRPAGSKDLGITAKDGIYVATWQKPDGTPVSAVWTISRTQNVLLKFSGELKSAYGHLGNPISPEVTTDGIRFSAGPGITYLVGVQER